MNVVINRTPIKCAELLVQGLVAGVFAVVADVLVKILPKVFEAEAVSQGQAMAEHSLAFAGAFLAVMSIWVWVPKPLPYEGKAVKDWNRRVMHFGEAGMIVGMIFSSTVMALALGVCIGGLSVAMEAPWRRSKRLDTYNVQGWSVIELECALQDLHGSDNTILVNTIKRELDQRRGTAG